VGRSRPVGLGWGQQVAGGVKETRVNPDTGGKLNQASEGVMARQEQ